MTQNILTFHALKQIAQIALASRVEMRERLCCQDAQSSPGTFQSSNRLKLTRFFESSFLGKLRKMQKIIKNLLITENSAWRHLKEEN